MAEVLVLRYTAWTRRKCQHAARDRTSEALAVKIYCKNIARKAPARSVFCGGARHIRKVRKICF